MLKWIEHELCNILENSNLGLVRCILKLIPYLCPVQQIKVNTNIKDREMCDLISKDVFYF